MLRCRPGPEDERQDVEMTALTTEHTAPMTCARRVSVIVPCHNRLGMLRDTLEGLLEQTFPASELEVILVDSTSTEPVERLADEYASRAPFPVRYLRFPDLHGPVEKRNRGARAAVGEVLAFTDSDCRPTPGWLAAGLAAFSQPEIALVSGPVTYKPQQSRSFLSKLSAEALVEHPTYPTANVFYRRDVFMQFGGFDTSLEVRDMLGRATECADTDLAWRVMKSGLRNRFAPEALVFHEVENLTLFQWLMEPTRLILLPMLLRLHPEVRARLLWRGTVFDWHTLPFYALLVYVPLALAIAPVALLALPIVFLGLGLRRAGTLRPSPLLNALREVTLNTARIGVMALTLITGSIRYGSIVL